jgi:hypothetical protein
VQRGQVTLVGSLNFIVRHGLISSARRSKPPYVQRGSSAEYWQFERPQCLLDGVPTGLHTLCRICPASRQVRPAQTVGTGTYQLRLMIAYPFGVPETLGLLRDLQIAWPIAAHANPLAKPTNTSCSGHAAAALTIAMLASPNAITHRSSHLGIYSF